MYVHTPVCLSGDCLSLMTINNAGKTIVPTVTISAALSANANE
jgi:hypothetical protein